MVWQSCFQVIKEHQIPEFDNLYLDMNGIIHPCSHPNDDNPHFRITEDQIFKDIFHYIECLFRIIRPRKVIADNVTIFNIISITDSHFLTLITESFGYELRGMAVVYDAPAERKNRNIMLNTPPAVWKLDSK